MIRFNLFLTKDSDDKINELIENKKIASKAELIRRAVDEYLEKHFIKNQSTTIHE